MLPVKSTDWDRLLHYLEAKFPDLKGKRAVVGE
jgi:hypothetical protein